MSKFSLTRLVPDDGAGDAGMMCHRVRFNEATQSVEELPCDYPMVGWCLKVGSPYARTMVGQDWWRTSPITEILEEDESEEFVHVTFKTGNSTYSFRRFK